MQIHEESTELSKETNTGRHTGYGSPVQDSRQHSPDVLQYKTCYNQYRTDKIRKSDSK